MKKIRVLLADDHTVVREGLRLMVGAAEDMEVVGEAGDGWGAVKLARKTVPEVIIMDLEMPLLNGLGAMREVLKQAPGTRVLVLSSYGNEDCVEQLMDAGAAGYLVKQTAATDLLGAIREVHKGGTFLSAALAKQWLDRHAEALPGEQFVRGGGRLTARELEVLRLIASGFSNKEAAAELGISTKTVEKHRQQVMDKLGIHECAGLTRYALSRRIVERQAQPSGLVPRPQWRRPH